MSKRANHWYIVKLFLQAVRPRSQRGWVFLAWLGLLTAFLAGVWIVQMAPDGQRALAAKIEQAEPFLRSPLTVPLIAAATMGVVLAFALRRARRFQAAFLQALTRPDPEPLIDVVNASLAAARKLSDWHAISTHTKVFAYALYGRGGDAEELLATVTWKDKAPLVEALGLNGEGLIELLCHRRPRRALDLFRRARDLSAVSKLLLSFAQTRRFHETCIAVAEVLIGTDTSEGRQWLDKSIADSRAPLLQVVAMLGIALVAERAQDRQRAQEARRFLLQKAPHCPPLHLKAADFSPFPPVTQTSH
jgi:hypothetical protein